jgi:mannosyltransferase OCH1-like enzyme
VTLHTDVEIHFAPFDLHVISHYFINIYFHLFFEERLYHQMYLKTCLQHLLINISSTYLRALATTFLLVLFLFTFRYNILVLFYIIQTYLNTYQFSSGVINSNDHFDPTMSTYPLNQTTATPDYTDVVPAILHHILIGDIDLDQRPTWVTARNACLQWHPNYEYKFWNDSSAEKLILEEYPWFFETWKNYPYTIQRADSLRYLILYRYGGIFLDLDLHCRRSLGPLRRFEFISPAAYPVGISNGFLMVAARHPFMKVLVDQLPLFNRRFIFPYATVMFSTGCMYLSAQYSLYNDRCHLRILDYQQHRLSGYISTQLFHHYGSSSWHSKDALFIKTADKILKVLFQHEGLVLIILLIAIIIIVKLFYRRRTQQKKEILLF